MGNGGAEKFLVELSNKLADDNTVLLCSFKAIESGMLFPKLLSTRVQLTSLNKKAGVDFSMYPKLFKLFKLERPDVVHFHLDATLKYILPLVLFFPNIKFIHTLHSDLNAEKIKIFNQLKLFKFIVKRVQLVCISPAIQKDFARAFPWCKFYMVENGVDALKETKHLDEVKKQIDLLKLNQETAVLISVGRLDENKNQELLMHAMNDLAASNVILLIVGDDPSVNKYYYHKLLNLKINNVFLLGSKENVADYLSVSDAFISSSLNEGLPISALEALSLGLSVISTPAGGLRSLINHLQNGFITKDFSIQEMVFSVKEFLSLTELQRKMMSQTNREKFLSTYTIEKCTENYFSLYKHQ